MATSLIRSRAAITGTKDRFSWNEVKDGAVLQEDGVITAIGTYEDLHAKHPTVKVKEGQAFIDWLVSPEGQAAIASYTIDGDALFFPSAGKSASKGGQ